ncbi:MAG TPA: hypothetical protein VN894_06665 [Polyangiaceae bacterium]|nr:hypothetical protein [Polyangiaceae bacterium]
MCPAVDFQNVSTAGLEFSRGAPALAGLRANEARYFKNKYDHVFTVEHRGVAAHIVAPAPTWRLATSWSAVTSAPRGPESRHQSCVV